MSQDNILKLISKSGGLNSREISNKLDIGMSSVTTVLKKLREQGDIKGIVDKDLCGRPMRYYTTESYNKLNRKIYKGERFKCNMELKQRRTKK